MGKIAETFDRLSNEAKMRFISNLESKIVTERFNLNPENIPDYFELYERYFDYFGPRIIFVLSEASKGGTSFNKVFSKLIDLYKDKNTRYLTKKYLKEIIRDEIFRTPKDKLHLIEQMFKIKGVSQMSEFSQMLILRRTGDLPKVRDFEKEPGDRDQVAYRSGKLAMKARQNRGPERAKPLTKLIRRV